MAKLLTGSGESAVAGNGLSCWYDRLRESPGSWSSGCGTKTSVIRGPTSGQSSPNTGIGEVGQGKKCSLYLQCLFTLFVGNARIKFVHCSKERLALSGLTVISDITNKRKE